MSHGHTKIKYLKNKGSHLFLNFIYSTILISRWKLKHPINLEEEDLYFDIINETEQFSHGSKTAENKSAFHFENLKRLNIRPKGRHLAQYAVLIDCIRENEQKLIILNKTICDMLK
ncbi:hypothetical protein A3Q56_00470 [Intoshia linei]|uniref:Uncharacterized protein n=1 Tax=Intoshia linei TaxID=1819745 RepID=A0A177BDI9_9BILA|nr:hypothetical protein A3Q56_00470 [Intoshia linei]